jgi:tryptophan synthase alpha chain
MARAQENATNGWDDNGAENAAALGTGQGARIDQVIAKLRREGRIGVMTHIVLGYPTMEASRQIVEAMARCGVDLIEVQLPFSDPTADGPTITAACQRALVRGVRVSDGINFVREAAARHSLPFLFMSYYNIVFNYHAGPGEPRGADAFASAAAGAGAGGLIVPDIPPEEAQEGYPEACREHGLHPIYVISPNITERRLEAVKRAASGFVYSTSRTGTTGREMELEMERLDRFLPRVREVTGLPIAVGFSITRREQIEALRGKADIAVIGSHLVRVYDTLGLAGLERELRGLVGRRD